jgi:transcriptional regulator with AAA-type ATPase domain
MINQKIIRGLDNLIESLCLLEYDDLQEESKNIKAMYLKDNAPRTKKRAPKKENISVEITQGTSTHTLQFDSSKALETYLKQLRKTHDAQVDTYCRENAIYKPIYRHNRLEDYDVEIFKNKMEAAKLNLSIKIRQDYDAI